MAVFRILVFNASGIVWIAELLFHACIKGEEVLKGRAEGRAMEGVGVVGICLKMEFFMSSYVHTTVVEQLVHSFLYSSHYLWCIFQVQSKHLFRDFVPRSVMIAINSNRQFIRCYDIPVPTSNGNFFCQYTW